LGGKGETGKKGGGGGKRRKLGKLLGGKVPGGRIWKALSHKGGALRKGM